MPSITDDISSKELADVKDSAIKAARSVPSAIKGLCLILTDVTEFTAKNVMVAVKNKVYKKTGNIKYSANNINMAKLAKSGRIHKVDEEVTAEVMKYFDKQCKRYRVKYSAMKDERNPDKPSYMVFFEGKDSELILHMMEESYKDYIKAAENNEKKSSGKEKDQGKSEKRDSVKAKLAFFRDRVAARDRERQEDVREKNYSHSDIQR